MKWFIGFFILSIFGCTHPAPKASPAVTKTAPRLGEIDPKHSSAKIFPNADSEAFHYFIVLNLKDKSQAFVDCELSEILVKTKDGQKFDFDLERNAVGKYYLKLKTKDHLAEKELRVSIKGKNLKEFLKPNMAKPDFRNTKMKILNRKSGYSLLQLDLRDAHNKFIEVSSPPEIILEGLIEIQEIKHVKEGIWQFELLYPEQNFIGYISVRANEVYLKDLFRFHHVEK
jgi:hypothetical protein